MYSTVDSLTQIYVFTADYLVSHPAEAGWRHFNNAQRSHADYVPGKFAPVAFSR